MLPVNLLPRYTSLCDFLSALPFIITSRNTIALMIYFFDAQMGGELNANEIIGRIFTQRHASSRTILLYSREIASRWTLVPRENRVQLENSLHTSGNGTCEMSNANCEFGRELESGNDNLIESSFNLYYSSEQCDCCIRDKETIIQHLSTKVSTPKILYSRSKGNF